MKKILLLMIAALAVIASSAAPVDQASAQRKAKSYLSNELYAGKIMAPAALNPVLLKAEMGDTKLGKPVYYIFNTSTTFLVVAGDDRAEEILMIGDAPLDMNRIPDGMQYMLDGYKEQIEYLQNNPDIQVDSASKQRRSLQAETYGPLLTANWDQSKPYNYYCKFTYNNYTYTCVTGCPATSAAMVLYYWRFPTAAVSQVATYSGTLSYNSYNEVTFSFPAYPASESTTTFDWVNMKDNYSNSDNGTVKGNAVAHLMRYVGQAEKMDYGVDASGIPSTSASRIVTMFKNLGYDNSTTRLVKKSSYTETNWASLIQAEMAASRPVVYMGVDNTSGGHAFNVDGYNSSTNKYHVNFGWSGYGNSWCAMNAFSYAGDTFSSSQQAVIGIQPPGGQVTTPTITVNPTSLTFTGEKGKTYTQTFTVTGNDLLGDVTITQTGSSYISVSPTTITAAQATAGATVTVTYSPAAAGTHTATLTLASPYATSQLMSITGTATAASPTLVADPTSLSFNTAVGTPVTQTFHLQGYNLTSSSPVTLAVSGSGFTIDKTQVTKTAVTNGVTVTVTYNPTASGNHTGTVTISHSGAESAVVTLNGTATASPMITVDPTSLSFSTNVGVPVTKTFTVTGSDLTNNIALAVSGAGFSIDKTTINKSAGTTTVTVTYNPTAAGTHTGTVTLTSTGAASKTVSLTGTAATVPTIAVNPASLSFDATVGTPVTKTFTVTGTYLTGDISMVVNGTAFSIDKSSISSTAGTTTVTVTYNPSAAGNHTGAVILTSSGAATKTVSLTGTAVEPVRTITATPTALNFTAMLGETKTATFSVTGENLTGPLTLTVDNDIYSVEPATISVAEATAGKTVTVTYVPTTFGVTSATVTISGGSAPSATVTLNGQADLVKYAPVMLPAVEDYINLTQFRADWTDASPEVSVASYTLEVSAKPVEEPEVVELLASIDGSSYNSQGYQAVTLQAPWSGNNVYGGYGALYFRNATHQSATTDGYIKYTIPAGYENKTFTLILTSASTDYGAGRFGVGSNQTAAVEYNMSKGETHSWVVTGSTGEVITITSPENQYSPDIAQIEVYSGNATEAKLMANETGDATYRLITGITDKFYTVENLTAEGTFLYKVKALYIDGTESDWSNIEEVTLFENGHGYELGDVNHDGKITISDVTALINYLLSGDDTEACPICADVNQDGGTSIGDVTTLINILLSSGAK